MMTIGRTIYIHMIFFKTDGNAFLLVVIPHFLVLEQKEQLIMMYFISLVDIRKRVVIIIKISSIMI